MYHNTEHTHTHKTHKHTSTIAIITTRPVQTAVRCGAVLIPTLKGILWTLIREPSKAALGRE